MRNINEFQQELSQDEIDAILEFINDINKRRNQNGLDDITQEEILIYYTKKLKTL
jgi:response regulator of citrate/malate metabolism